MTVLSAVVWTLPGMLLRLRCVRTLRTGLLEGFVTAAAYDVPWVAAAIEERLIDNTIKWPSDCADGRSRYLCKNARFLDLSQQGLVTHPEPHGRSPAVPLFSTQRVFDHRSFGGKGCGFAGLEQAAACRVEV